MPTAPIKLLLFAHVPPPHHGQSFMVQLLLRGLGGDQRQASLPVPHPLGIACFHVDSRLSANQDEIGRTDPRKIGRVLRYCAEAIWCRWRYGITSLYYVPAPAKRGALYRDWLVMALCRPFFKRIILHWHAIGLGTWLDTEAKPWERAITRRLLGRVSLSIVLNSLYCSDAARLQPRHLAIVPNGIPDPCPDYEGRVKPRQVERARRRRELPARDTAPCLSLSGAGTGAGDVEGEGEDPRLFRLLFVSACLPEKGLFDLLEAVAWANGELRSAPGGLRLQLFVAGEFKSEADRTAFAARLAREDLNGQAPPTDSRRAVVYRGFVAGAEKEALFAGSDCFCFPTYYPLEGHPVCLLEAMAFGLPIVTTRWRAIPELFPPGYAGLVEPRSPRALGAVLLDFARNNAENEFRQTFLREFVLETHLQRMAAALAGQPMPMPTPEGRGNAGESGRRENNERFAPNQLQ